MKKSLAWQKVLDAIKRSSELVLCSFASNVGVNVVYYFLADDAQFAFRRVDQMARWVVGEVFFVVFKGAEGLSRCDAFGSVVYLKISCY